MTKHFESKRLAAIERNKKFTKEERSAHGKKMIKARLSKMTAEQRKEMASIGARARWDKEKKLSTGISLHEE